MTAMIIDSVGQPLSSTFFYSAKGETITIGESRKYTLKTVKELLELTYVDNPMIGNDEIVIKFAPF